MRDRAEAARRAHNPEVVSSNLTLATRENNFLNFLRNSFLKKIFKNFEFTFANLIKNFSF